jgi:hypothetical protein
MAYRAPQKGLFSDKSLILLSLTVLALAGILAFTVNLSTNPALPQSSAKAGGTYFICTKELFSNTSCHSDSYLSVAAQYNYGQSATTSVTKGCSAIGATPYIYRGSYQCIGKCNVLSRTGRIQAYKWSCSWR